MLSAARDVICKEQAASSSGKQQWRVIACRHEIHQCVSMVTCTALQIAVGNPEDVWVGGLRMLIKC